MNKMMKIFENQTTMLEKALTEQSVIESKYKQMETDFQMLVLEKTLLEGEIRRLREIEGLPAGGVVKAKKEERTKKSGKAEKKKVKDKEKKLSPTREFKSFEELLQIQKEAEALKTEKKTLQEQLKWALEEAERNKTQLDFVLQQKMETFKEEQSKTKLDRGHSKSKVKGEGSKDLSKKSDTQSSGQRKVQISSDQSKRSVGERSEKTQFAEADPLALEDFPPGTFKSFTALPLIEEHRESTSPQPNEDMAEASEQSEGENIEGPFEMISESPNEDDLLPEDEAPTTEQNVLNEDEEQDKNVDKKGSDTGKKSKRKKDSKTGKLPTHEEESERVHYEEARKAKVPSKKQGMAMKCLALRVKAQSQNHMHIQGNKELTKKEEAVSHDEGSDTVYYEEVAQVPSKKQASDADGDEALSPESQGSVSKERTHTKKQRTHKRGRGSAHGEESDTVYYEEPRKPKASSRRKGFAIPIKRQIEAHSPESQGSISKSDTETKEQETHKKGRGSVADGALRPGRQGSVSKADTVTKKQRSSKRERTLVLNEVPDKNLEHQESGLKFEIQAKKLKMFRPENIHNEESDTDVKLEYQNVPSSSQVQLKKQKSLGGEIFTTPDESHAKLHQEYTSETQVQVERGTTSGTARLTTIPLEHRKKEADQLFHEKRLYITTAQSQTKKPHPPWDDNVDSQNIELRADENYMSVDPTSKDHPQFKKLKTAHIENTWTQKKSVIQVQGISEPQTELNPTMSDIISHLDMDRVIGSTNLKWLLKLPIDFNTFGFSCYQSRSQVFIYKSFETDLENLKEILVSHALRSELEIGTDTKNMPATSRSREPVKTESKSNQDKTITIVKGIKLLAKLKDQHGLSSFANKDTISPGKSLIKSFIDNQEKFLERTSANTDVVPTPIYRTSRGSSGISEALQHLLNIKTSGHLKPTSIKKQNVELEKHLRISVRSSNKYIHKGQSKYQKLKKQSALISTIKQKHKEQKKTKNLKQPKPETIVEFDDDQMMTVSPPNIKIIKELSKTLNLEGGDIEVPDLLVKTVSAVKKLVRKERSKTNNLDKEDSQNTHILHLTTSAIMRLLFKEQAKIRSLEKKLIKGSKILHKSTSSLKKFLFEEPSKTKKKRKKRKIVVKSPHVLPTTQKQMLKEQSEISNLEKPIVRGTRILNKSSFARKKRVLKAFWKSKRAILYKKCENYSDDLVLSTSGSSKQEVEEQPKPENVDMKVSDDAHNLNISISAIKMPILKGQSKSRALYEKGIDLPNNLVLSTSDSSKQEIEGQPKPENVDKKVSDDSYRLNISTSTIKKHIPKEQPKPENVDKKVSDDSHSLNISTSPTKKHILKGQSKSRTLYDMEVNLPNNLVLSTSASSKQELKGKTKSGNVGKKVSDDSHSLNISTSTIKKNILKGQSKSRTLYEKGFDLPNDWVLSTSASSKQELKGQPKSEKSDEKGFKHPNNLHTSASAARKRLLKG
ncbi:Coiled-coil domain-containing 7A [Apodemus speciosus]|uniref:Coiled-coil domain-containing 7A n=1 Tax=Apodemus speciosus TaxID=105296 RepID=A0ABQ0F3N2_APOSI